MTQTPVIFFFVIFVSKLISYKHTYETIVTIAITLYVFAIDYVHEFYFSTIVPRINPKEFIDHSPMWYIWTPKYPYEHNILHKLKLLNRKL